MGSTFLVAVHSHVQGSVLSVGEPAIATVELRGTDSEVEHHADHLLYAELLENAAELIEPSVVQLHTVAEGFEPTPGRVEGINVTIDAEQSQVRTTGEDRRAVAATAGRCVDEQPRRDVREEFDDPIDHDRVVDEFRYTIVAPIAHSPSAFRVS